MYDKLPLRQQSPVFRSILLSYLIICMILLAATGMGYANYSKTLSQTISNYAEQQADLTSLQAERKYAEIQNLLTSLSANQDLISYSRYGEEDFSRQVSEMRSLRSSVANSLMTTACNDLYIYFYQSHAVMGTRSRNFSSILLPTFFKTHNITEDEFQHFIEFPGLFQTKAMGRELLWIMRPVFSNTLQRVGVLIAEVKASEITSYIDEYYRNNLVVLFSGDELLFSSQQLTDAEIASIRTENEESFHIQLQSKNYRMAKESSLELGLTFYIGIPADRLYQGIRNFRILFIAEVLIAGVIALFLSWKFASRTYEPVKQLIDILGKHTDSRFQETYDNLIVQLRKLVDENQILAESDKQRKLLADQAAMRRVLDGKITDAAAIEALLRESARISETDSYQMCLIYVPASLPEQVSAQGTTDKQGDIALKTFMLQNVVRERVLNQFGGALYAYNDTSYVVLIQSGGTDDHVCEITERLKQVSAFYKSALDFYPCIVLSRPLIGVKNIADTFSRLLEELRYQLFWMDETAMGNVWREGDSAGVEEKKDFGQYLDYSRRLMNCLEIGNYKEASAVLDDMFLHAFPRGKADLKYNVYRMYGLISTISMTLNANTDSKDQAFGDSLNYEERLFSIKNFGHFRIVSKEIFSAILEYNAANEKRGMPSWMEDMLEYLQQKYTDPSLNVSAVADHFHLSVPHLSRTFKTNMGIGVLEYIHRLRLEKAKSLLGKGVSVQDAAVQSGFLDAKALRRTFRSYEGINPANYRELSDNGKS